MMSKAAYFVVGAAILLLQTSLPGGSARIVDGIPLDAPAYRILDDESTLSQEDRRVLEDAIEGLVQQTDISAWVITGPANTNQEVLRGAARRVHTWRDTGLGIVLYYPANPELSPHLAVSQDLMAQLPEGELQQLRSEFERIWESQRGEMRDRVTVSALHALEYPKFYRLQTGLNVEEDTSVGLTSDKVDDLDIDQLRGRFRDSWATDEELTAEPPVAQSIPGEQEIGWRWQVIGINIAIFALFVSGGVWWYLYSRGLEQQREEAMRRGGQELSGLRPRDGSDTQEGWGRDGSADAKDSESNRKNDIY